MPSASRLSPRYMTNGSPRRKSSEISTACARPRGASCGTYVTSRPKREPSPTAARISACVSPTMIATSRMPASRIDSSAKNSTGLFATGTSCFAAVCVIGARRVPAPPARINPRTEPPSTWRRAYSARGEARVGLVHGVGLGVARRACLGIAPLAPPPSPALRARRRTVGLGERRRRGRSRPRPPRGLGRPRPAPAPARAPRARRRRPALPAAGRALTRRRRVFGRARSVCAGMFDASASASDSGSSPSSTRALSIRRPAVESWTTATASIAAPCGRSAWFAAITSSRALTWWSSPRALAIARSRSRACVEAAVATRNCTSREALASRHVQATRCDSEPAKPPSPSASSSTRAPCARSAAQVGAASIRRTTRSTVFGSGWREARSPSAASRSARCLHSAAQVAKNVMRVSSETFASVAVSRVRSVGRDAPGGGLGPQLLLVGRQHVGRDRLPVGDDRGAPALRVVGDRHEPVDLAHHRARGAAPALAAARRSRRDERAGPVDIRVEQAVQRHRAVRVRRRGIGEVDDDARPPCGGAGASRGRRAAGRRAGSRSARGACRSSRAGRSSPRRAAAR